MEIVGTALSVIFFIGLGFIIWDWFMLSFHGKRGLEYIEKNWHKLDPQDQQQLLELFRQKLEEKTEC